MYNWDVCYSDLDGVQVLRNACGPVTRSDGRHAQRHRFVESLCGDIDRVSYALHILNRHFAGANGHGRNLLYSYIVRHADFQQRADAYLLSFAIVAGLKLVTFDRGIQSREAEIHIL
jgi:hypothetical protein